MLKTLSFATIEVPYSCFSDSHGLPQYYTLANIVHCLSKHLSIYIYIYIKNTACCLPACVRAGGGRVSKPFQFTKSNCFLFVYALSPHTTALLLPLCILPIGGTILSTVP